VGVFIMKVFQDLVQKVKQIDRDLVEQLVVSTNLHRLQLLHV
jgi:hypothetical protein